MRKPLFVLCIALASTALWAQQGSESKPFPAQHNTPGSRQGPGSFNQSTIQGCLAGSETTSTFVVTDEHTGEIYLLHGNDSLLKEQVGHDVMITGTAYPLRPSDKKGRVGYINPSAPNETATSNRAGEKGMNFDVSYVQPLANSCAQQTESQKSAIAASQAALGTVQSNNTSSTEPKVGYTAQSQSENQLVGCVSGSANDLLLSQPEQSRTYRLKGDTSELKNDLGKMVSITGHLQPGSGPSRSGATEAAPILQVTGTQVIQDTCSYLPNPGHAPIAATGKTGNTGEAFPVTDTSTSGRNTPGNETQAGKAQAPGPQTALDAGGVPQPQNQTAAQGAPQTAEQTAQNPAAGERIASSAERAEINNSQHQLGVNAQPNYNQSAAQQTTQANQPVQGSPYEMNRNPQTGTRLPGESQTMRAPKKGEQEKEKQAEERQRALPTLIGCLTSTGKASHEFFLTEKNSGTRYRLLSSREELKDHVNHLVEVVGKPAGQKGRAVAGGSEPQYDVSGIQDLAPTCGTPTRR